MLLGHVIDILGMGSLRPQVGHSALISFLLIESENKIEEEKYSPAVN